MKTDTGTNAQAVKKSLTMAITAAARQPVKTKPYAQPVVRFTVKLTVPITQARLPNGHLTVIITGMNVSIAVQTLTKPHIRE